MYSISLNFSELKKLEKFISKNGNEFISVTMFINDTPDKFNNTIQLKAKFENEFIFVGNGKKFVKKESNETVKNDLPF
ncbi:hypothetical protein [Flavobacterium sp.]|uniref:hypothetical protein n=1 Tax=Flavobacterium sp. TaxID=239 RepID=UPI00334267FE